ncbi:MAG: exosortase/archaeosortase family protein, partial [Candidatus Aenigmarchaeota archaeon]|nr:exosortase/archaeosortase family protein [Candidatus Aenigmarchaeota archaeon]
MADNLALRKTLVFLARLAVLSLPLYLVLAFGLDLAAMQVAAASHTNFVLGLLGFQTEQHGALSVAGKGGDSFVYVISADSSGWKSMLFFAALVVAVPAIGWRKRAIGIAIGLVVIWFGNVARAVSIVLAEYAYGYEFAMALHDLLWRLGLVALVLAVWLAWLFLI